MMNADEVAKASQWFDREGLLQQRVSGDHEQQQPVDLEFLVHPEALGVLAQSERGEQWIARYKDVINPPNIQEIHRITGDYISIHKIRILDLAKRCDMTCTLIGTEEEFGWWKRFTKALADDAEVFNQATQQGAAMFASPAAFYWLDAFKTIHRNKRKL